MRLGCRKWSLAGFMIVLGTLALLMIACDSSATPAGNEKAPDSQQIFHYTLFGEADIATMDPDVVQDTNAMAPVDLVWPQMLVQDKNLHVVPWAAQSLPSVDATGTVYTFKLRPNMKFSDGEAIDANTFAFSLNRSLDPCTASPVAYYLLAIKSAVTFNGEICKDATTDAHSVARGQMAPVIDTLIGSSIMVLDPQTLRITLERPAAYFIQAITYPTSYGVPVNLVKQYGSKWTDHLTDKGGGFGGNLFELASWPHDGTIKLIRNESFWGDTKATLKEIDFTIYKRVESDYTAYISNQNDLGVPPGAQYPTAKTKPDFHETGQLWINYYGFNWNIAPFTDLGVRQAFDLALDKQAIANQVLHGTVNATNHIVPQGMSGYNPTLTGPDDTRSLTGNVSLARQKAAPYVQAHCAGQYKNCPAVTLTYPAIGQGEVNQDTAALGMWRAAFPGWPIKIQATDLSTMLNDLAAHDLQAYSFEWIADYPDPQDWLTLQFTPGSGDNSSNVNDPMAQALMEKADGEFDQTQRMKDYNAAEQMLVTEVAWCPLFQVKLYYELRPYVKNFQIDAQNVEPMTDWVQVYIAKH